MKNGVFYDCRTCGSSVKGRDDRPYTLGRWNEHKKCSEQHRIALQRKDREKELRLMAKKNDGTMTSRDEAELKHVSHKQVSIRGLFLPRMSKKEKNKKVLIAAAGEQTQSVSASQSAIDLTITSEPKITTSKNLAGRTRLPGSCEGVFPDYGDRQGMQKKLVVYGSYAAIGEQSAYKADVVGPFAQIFAKECNGAGASVRNSLKQKIFQCDNCNNL